MEHRDDYGYTFEHLLNRDDTKANAISIDELESKTGIDFFCNLPDILRMKWRVAIMSPIGPGSIMCYE